MMMMMGEQEDETMVFLSSILDFEDGQDGGGEVEGKKSAGGRRRRRRREEKLGLKRKLSEKQTTFLERSFEEESKLESARKLQLASETGLDPKQVAVWFQNKRARWKNKQLEDKYSQLKSQHQDILFQKCHLESQVLILKQQLIEAQTTLTKVYSDQDEQNYGGGGGGGDMFDWVNLYGI